MFRKLAATTLMALGLSLAIAPAQAARSKPTKAVAADVSFAQKFGDRWFDGYWQRNPDFAVANGYYMGNINRVGTEAPWNIGKFYGQSYFVDPRGQFLATGSRDDDDLVIADLDLDQIKETRHQWQFYRDRRPETYGDMTALLP